MRTFSEVIDAFGGSRAFADALNIDEGHARVMRWRDSIPPHYWTEVAEEAARRGIKGVTLDVLAAIVAANRGRVGAA